MARWVEIEAEVPALVAAVRRLLEARKHKTLATLRRDGSPRISGTETELRWGDLWLGSMPGAVKALDLQRDPRYALHGGSEDPPAWHEDAKVSGKAEEITDSERVDAYRDERTPPGPFHLFRLDIDEMSWLRMEGNLLIIESWHQGRGYQRRERG